MTDEQILRTLAEFMGWTCDGDPLALESLWRNPSGDFPNHQFTSPPPYLASYDALAPVWRKVLADDSGRIHRNSLYAKACMGLPAATWSEITPRDHALALAKAIQEAKK